MLIPDEGDADEGAFFLQSFGFMWYKGLRNLIGIGIMEVV